MTERKPQRLAQADRDRPSAHGAILGDVLARLAVAGAPEVGDYMCATCAFRPGCMTNQMAGTGMTALKCAIGADPDNFACHHGMKDGMPTRICAGYVAAKLAPWSVTQEIVCGLSVKLAEAEGNPDPIREAFDAWVAKADPDNLMDDYQRGRAYLRTLVKDTEQ